MSPDVAAAIGFAALAVLTALGWKKRISQSVYIPLTVALGACAAFALAGLYGRLFGSSFNLYFYILITLLVGLLADFIVRKTVKQDEPTGSKK